MFRKHSVFQSLFMDICKTETCRNFEFVSASCEKCAKKGVCSSIWKSQIVACGKYICVRRSLAWKLLGFFRSTVFLPFFPFLHTKPIKLVFQIVLKLISLGTPQLRLPVITPLPNSLHFFNPLFPLLTSLHFLLFVCFPVLWCLPLPALFFSPLRLLIFMAVALLH